MAIELLRRTEAGAGRSGLSSGGPARGAADDDRTSPVARNSSTSIVAEFDAAMRQHVNAGGDGHL